MTSPTTIKLLLLCYLAFIQINAMFCSSNCASWYSACYSENTNSCYACAPSLYNLNPVQSNTPRCGLKRQTSIIGMELLTDNMSLIGYQSSQTSPRVCTNYTLSGQYTSLDFISKNFTNLPLNHYELVIRFSVAYVGAWTNSSLLNLIVQDEKGTTQNTYDYACTETEYMCDVSTQGCIRTRQFILRHNTSFAFLQFSALTSETDPAVQFWGIKDLIVAIRTCNANCLTCFNSSDSQCLTCRSGFYLQGNVCVQKCSINLYTIESLSQCAPQCPAKFASISNATGNVCLPCPSGCLSCSDESTCLMPDALPVPNIWMDKLEFWILLIIVCSAIIVFVIWKLYSKKKNSGDLEEKMIKSQDKSDQKENDRSKNNNDSISENMLKQTLDKHENNLNISTNEIISIPNESGLNQTNFQQISQELWFSELKEMEHEIVPVRPKRRRQKVELDIQQNIGDDITSNDL